MGSPSALTPVDVLGALEEPGHVVLQHGQGLVELLQHPDHRVVLLNILLGLPHRYLCVEPPGDVAISWVLLMARLQYWVSVWGWGILGGSASDSTHRPGEVWLFGYSRAVLRMATEEHGLSAVVTEAVPPLARYVPTLGVPRPHARLEVLGAG